MPKWSAGRSAERRHERPISQEEEAGNRGGEGAQERPRTQDPHVPAMAGVFPGLVKWKKAGAAELSKRWEKEGNIIRWLRRGHEDVAAFATQLIVEVMRSRSDS
jgi:hypothetical protein